MSSALRTLLLGCVIVVAACERTPPGQQTSTAAGGTTTAAAASDQAPDSFRVVFETSKGRVVAQAVRRWAPRGVDRFYALVNSGYYDGVKFFRVLPDFMAQFGISGDPAVTARWDHPIADDSVTQSNLRGFISFATAGPGTRTAQLFINTRDNVRLDGMGFAPIAKVVEGMSVVDGLYMGYGEGAPSGAGPSQDRITNEGNAYLNRYFPRLDSIITARVVRTTPD